MSVSLSSLSLGISPSSTLALNEIVSRLRAQGADIISLGAGEPDLPTPDAACEAAISAIRKGCTRYTDVSGILPLRQAICQRLQAQKGLHYIPQSILVGAGAKQVLYEALLAILDPGDEVLLPAPYWISYPEMIRMAGGTPVILPPEKDFLPTPDTLEKAITPHTKALIINTPNNPSGAVWPQSLLKEAACLAQKHNFYIISDEIYEDFVYDGLSHISPASFSAAFDRTIVVSGFSKAFAMTGWRVGYAAGPQSVIDAMSALQSHSSGNACSIAQYAALGALSNTQSTQEMSQCFARRRSFLLKKLSQLALFPAVLPQGAFYMLLPIAPFIGKSINGETITGDRSFADLLLLYEHIAVVPGSDFGAPNHVRISYAVHEETLERAADRMAHFLNALQ